MSRKRLRLTYHIIILKAGLILYACVEMLMNLILHNQINITFILSHTIKEPVQVSSIFENVQKLAILSVKLNSFERAKKG